MSTDRTPPAVSPPLRLAAVSYVSDLVFAAFMPFALAHLARRGQLPMTPWGFRAFSGPFERLGTRGFTALGSILVVVGVLDAIAGIWLWQGSRRGALLALALTPLTSILAAGFALPLLLIPLPIRTLIVVRAVRRRP